MVIERACERLGWNLAEQRCVVQGFGNVGGIAAHELADARRDRGGGLGRLRRRPRPERGLDVHATAARGSPSTARSRSSPAGARITNEELLELPCDVLVLAAREDQLTEENAPRIQARS